MRHVCFDKDGTLTDVHRYWDHVCRLRTDALLRAFRLEPSWGDFILESLGIDPATGRVRPGGPVGHKPRQAIVEHVSARLHGRGVEASPEAIHARFADVDRHQQSEDDYRIELLPGVRETLVALKAAGVALSVYSSDRKENCARVLEKLGLAGHFAAVVGGGCVSRPKPDPEGFTEACRLAGVEPADSAYAGDTGEDMRLGLAGGAKAVYGIVSGVGTAEELRAHTPFVYERMSGLLEV